MMGIFAIDFEMVDSKERGRILFMPFFQCLKAKEI